MKKDVLIFIVVIVIECQGWLFAQPPLPASPNAVPIDGGLSLLALAGGAYAFKKLRANKQEDQP